MTDIAIVGLDCRFPGASDPIALWQLLMRSEDGISRIPDDRWAVDAYYSPEGGMMNTREAGLIESAATFDHLFFGISPREAEAMDPQQRLMLQTVWRALEDATIDPRGMSGSNAGVYVGVMGNEWSHQHMTAYERITPQHGTGNGYCMIANRISYQLDLRGPSMAIDTACSSSMVATLMACTALRAGDCDIALAAGVNVILTPALNIFYTQAGLSATDGRCRPFSRDARGIGRGEGVGVLVLKRLDDAIRDGLPIYATIKGGAINHDGRSNGITAPNRWAQRDVLTEAYRRAGVAPEELSFIEAHGTGTILGDMIEAKALGDVHAGPRKRLCTIGSIKGNLGHTEGAAGVAGLIKVALALHHGIIPPSRYGDSENPQLTLADKGLRLAKLPERLTDRHCYAGASSFGLGGTNAHMVLASRPAYIPPVGRPAAGIVTLSSPNQYGLQRNLRRLTDDLAERPAAWFGQLAWNSNRMKSSGRHRFAIVASDRAHALTQLRKAMSDTAQCEALSGIAGVVKSGWLFTGQGSQYVQMSRALFQISNAYRRALSEVDVHLTAHLGRSIVELMFEGEETIHHTAFAQPALFALGYALGKVLSEAGVQPAWMLGHSIGEFAAAALGGVFTLEEACLLIVERGRLMGQLPPNGGMLAIQCSAEYAGALLADEPLLSLAVINASDRIVISGESAALERINARVTTAGLAARKLEVSHAFHSVMMEPVLEPFRRFAEKITYRPSQVPIYSTLRGRLLNNDEMDAEYWTQHMREPVQFAAAARAAIVTDTTHVIEIGPRRILSSLAAAVKSEHKIAFLAPCPGPQANGYELLETIAHLYRNGANIHWDAIYDDDQKVRRRLSPYEFSTEYSYWAHAPKSSHGYGEDAQKKHPSTAGINNASSFSSEPITLNETHNRSGASAVDDLQIELINLIAQVGGYPPEQVTMQTRLYEDLGYDSIIALQLKERIAQRWKQQIELQSLFSDMRAVSDLVSFLSRHLFEAQSQEAN